MPKLSVTVITRDEAANLAAALESVAWADEIVVVDSESTDATLEVARRFTRRVVVRRWPGYVAQKNYAAAEAAHDWILSLDADERVSPELADEIRRLIAGEPEAAGFRVPRVTFHLGRWIRSTDWYRTTSSGSTTAAGPAGRAAMYTNRSPPTVRFAPCGTNCGTTHTATCRTTCRRWIATPRWPRARCGKTAAGPGGPTSRCTRRWHSCATTSSRPASATVYPG